MFSDALKLECKELHWIKYRTLKILVSLSEEDGNSNDDARKQWSDWLNEEKNNRAARAARTFVAFFDVDCQMTNLSVNTKQQIFHSLYLLERRFYQCISRGLYQQ